MTATGLIRGDGLAAIEPSSADMALAAPVPAEAPALDLIDLTEILLRRKWILIVPTLVLALISGLVARYLPAEYRATATILVEQPRIPTDLVRTTVTSRAGERIQSITHRVMTSANLGSIVERYGLYDDMPPDSTIPAVVARLRKDTKVDTVVDASGARDNSTIAFTISYENRVPELTQKVVSDLVGLYLNENVRKRREAARETSRFLAQEGERLAAQISAIEVRFADFKREHQDILPEMRDINVRTMQTLERDLERNARDMRDADQRVALLESELSRTPRNLSGNATGAGSVPSPRERLLELEMRYSEMSTRLTAQHPDLIGLKGQIDTLRTASSSTPGNEVALTRFDNPAFSALRERLTRARATVSDLRARDDRLGTERAEYRRRLEAGPAVERDYRLLTRDYDNSLEKYREVKAKELEAELAESLEAESKSERFVLLEPAVVPAEPFKPNRKHVMVMGLVMSLATAIGLVALCELLSRGIYNHKTVTTIVGAAPLAVIPYLETRAEVTHRRVTTALVATVALLFTATLVVAFLMWRLEPIDAAVAALLQRYGL